MVKQRILILTSFQTKHFFPVTSVELQKILLIKVDIETEREEMTGQSKQSCRHSTCYMVN